MKASWAGMGIAAVFLVLALSFSPSAADRSEAGLTPGLRGVGPDGPATAEGVELSWHAASVELEDTATGNALQADDAAGEDDERVLVSLATFGAAVTAVVVGSVGYLLRRWLGLVKPPPAQGPEH